MPVNLKCEVCRLTNEDESKGFVMLLCDACNTGWHMHCLTPPLTKVPDGGWFCPRCANEHEAPTQSGALQLEGRQVVTTDAKVPRIGVVLPNDNTKGRPYLIVFGDSRPALSWTRAQVLQHMLPRHADDQTVTDKVKSLTTAKSRRRLMCAKAQKQEAYAFRPIETRQDLEGFLHTMMPGEWAAAHITGLHNQIVKQDGQFKVLHKMLRTGKIHKLRREDVHTSGFKETLKTSREIVQRTGIQTVCTMKSEVEALTAVINFKALRKAADPWAGGGSIARHMPIPVISGDRNPVYWWLRSHDALQHEVVDAIASDHMTDAVVTSPQFSLLDIAIPRLEQAKCKVTCIHVPGHYFHNMPSPRRDYIARLSREQRIMSLQCRDIGPLGRRCTWLLIFRDAYWKQVLVKKGPDQETITTII